MGYQDRLPAAPLKRELRRARRLYGITWEELADRLRISSRTLTRLLGARDVAEPVADRLACRLGLHPVLIWRHGNSRGDGSKGNRSHAK